MKIAVVCDWLVTVGGAEKVLEQIIECFPEADLFAVIDFLPQKNRSLIKNKLVTTTFIQKLPRAKSSYRNYLPLMPLAIEQLDVSKYDIVISSSHAVAKGVLTGPNQLHICYCHSPIRYAWDLQHEYLRESNLTKGLKSWLVRWFLHKIRIWDVRTSNNVDYFIANSHFIAKRIYKVYRREAAVIYPPVDILDNFETTKEEYYLAASRLVPYKKMHLIVEAFCQMPTKKLIVIGDGPDYKKVSQAAKGYNNIQILGYQEGSSLRQYLAKAKALIFAAEEDFGIIPVEAQAAGTPVIAYAKGGALETIIDVKEGLDKATGKLFFKQDANSIINAIDEFERIGNISPTACRENAERFSTVRFKEEFSKYVLDKYREFIQK